MQQLNDFLATMDGYIGGSQWFVFLLLGTGIFFTFYLGFPQIRYFRQAIRIVRGKYDHESHEGDTSHFQALATALSGTVGTGNIAGVAFAIHLGGPAALFWMLVTAAVGMCTKFVEVSLSHKYREKAQDGTISGGPMYYMKNANFMLFGKKINWKPIAFIFAIATVISSFGTGSLPQINSISNAMFSTFGIEHWITGLVLTILLGLIIIGGIKRIAKVSEMLVPGMAIIYFIGSIGVILYNYDNIIPSIVAIFSDLFTGSAATGGFLGATIAFAFNRGVNRGLFSNESGQGSAPIAHAAAKAHEPISEGMVAILEPFIDTIIICTLTGLAVLSSGAWTNKYENTFQVSDMTVLNGKYTETIENDKIAVFNHISGKSTLPLFNGSIPVINGEIVDYQSATIIHARSFAEDVQVLKDDKNFNGIVEFKNGKPTDDKLRFKGKSLLHSAPLTAEVFQDSLFGIYGKYIVTIGLLLFAFSTAISWSYYGDRAITFLWGSKAVIYYHVVYVAAFFVASFTDTTIIWTFSGIAIALMTIPNLIGIFWLRKEMKQSIKEYWEELKK